jgi:ParB/RepB/Spo0J family partition protein
MKTIEIEKIKLKENVRTDYGELTELSASIKAHGLRNPVELNNKNELIDGYRRVKAAKAAGLKEVPYFVNETKVEKTTAQLISGIFQKNLNPVEEGRAFEKYIKDNKSNVKNLSKILSKKEVYIEKRLKIANLPAEIQKSLIEGKILMGHALLLAKLPKNESMRLMKQIISRKQSVEDAKESLVYSEYSGDLKKVKFDKSACKECPYNGNQQTELFETGSILNGKCMNPVCYMKKLNEFIKLKKKEYAGVLFETEREWETPSGYVDGVNDWQCKDKGITEAYKEKCRKNKENYLVKITKEGEIKEYFRIPAKKENSTEAQTEKIEEKRESNLSAKVNVYKTQFLIEKTLGELKSRTIQAKALQTLRMIQEIGSVEMEDIAALENMTKKGEYSMCEIDLKKIFNAKEDELEDAMTAMSAYALDRLALKELIEVSRNFGVDVKTHFQIDKEYLELHTKDQLNALIVELKLQPAEETKRDEIIQHILNQDLKGKIPNIIK